LLVSGEHRQGVTHIRARLLAFTLKARTQLIRVAQAGCPVGGVTSYAPTHTRRIHARAHRTAAVGRPAGNRSKADHLRVGQPQLARSGEEELGAATPWAAVAPRLCVSRH
jgi:hypothetical protein